MILIVLVVYLGAPYSLYVRYSLETATNLASGTSIGAHTSQVKLANWIQVIYQVKVVARPFKGLLCANNTQVLL